ncbi:hypothetical protein EW026_g2958 [Hermanssonia centrifuga]|uniref:Zn(2)-C6 fungal-type domain-containing protein n=1 Tax=Hermanssonia centrifuga TaxID=98765 RepID=A0A4S4KLM1_9APHY|nr:hypothetical protein EW026_g2958 [Hermanssonia centrifuga]
MSSFRLPRPDFPTDSTFSDALMDDNLQYPAVSQYAQAYYASSLHGHMHAPAALPRPEQPTRKRPKYTRSKTGCLTCRAKKVKCDEAKPDCTRCQQGQRECRWPDGVPARKKPSVKRDSQSAESPVFDARPSTAGSSVSDLSTPPIRNLTPPAKLEPMDMGLPPLISRRQSDSLLHAPVALKMEDPRQHM